jgi:septum site-determining protein MinC
MTRMAPPSHGRTALHLRACAYRMVTLAVGDATPDEFEAALAERMATTPGLFWKTPLVLDLSSLPAEAGERVPAILDVLRRFGLVPAAVQAQRGAVLQAAEAAGLAPLIGGGAENPEASPRHSTRIVRQPVRSGQRIHADGADLVVLGSVSEGAEISADGCIHVHGALRGAAFAGMDGDTDARIFAKNMNPSRLSIAGLWLGAEDIPPAWCGVPAQLCLVEGLLRFEPLP